MEVLLAQVTHQAMNYAIRSGVAITSGYAIKQCTRLLKEAPKSEDREELVRLQVRLESKIRVISPSIDMIELIAARGNTALESAVTLTKDIRFQLQRLAVRLSDAANEEELLRQKSSRARSRENADREVRGIIAETKALLARIEDAVPLINLAITTSGVNLSTKLSGSVSPSRLLQASTFLTIADTNYTAHPCKRQQVGPTYKLSVYMLFAGHLRPNDAAGLRETTWKEVLHKASVKLWRVPLEDLYCLPGESSKQGNVSPSVPAEDRSVEFAYQLVLIEDFDDDRVHTVENDTARPGPIDGVENAGIRDVIPVHQISKLFYADTGKILNIDGNGDVNNPVLLLKRDIEAEPPRRMMQQTHSFEDLFDNTEPTIRCNTPSVDEGKAQSGQKNSSDASFRRGSEKKSEPGSAWGLPPDLDPEWIALEVYSEQPEVDSEDEDYPELENSSFRRSGSLELGFVDRLTQLALHSSPISSSPSSRQAQVPLHVTAMPRTLEKSISPALKTSLSLMEMLIKLTAIQQFRQESHLAIEDELLNFFLEESGTAGAGADKDRRQRVRHNAMRRVGFDPYDESPIKRRGEAYIQHANHSPLGSNRSASTHAASLPYDDAYDYTSPTPPLQSPTPLTNQLRTSVGHTPSTENTPPFMARRLQSHLQTPSRSSTVDFHAEPGKPNVTKANGHPDALPRPTSERVTPSYVQGHERACSPLAKTIEDYDI